MTQSHLVGLRTRVLYGVGATAFGVKDNGFSGFLLLYYNQVLGLPETWVGFGIMAALMVDALFDPLIGFASDHLHSRWGRRHPFMYAAALPAALSYWLLWNPPAGLSPHALFAYFLGVSIVVRMCIAVYEIPSASLVPELTRQYDERTSIVAHRYFFGWWGGLTMAVVAYGFLLQPDAEHPTGVLNPHGYHRYGVIAGVIMFAAILTSTIGTHRCIPYLSLPAKRLDRSARAAFRELRETLAARSFLALFAAAIFASMATGLTSSLAIYFNTYFWELSSSEISVLVLAAFLSTFLAAFLTPRLSKRLGKKPAAIRVSITAVLIGPTPIVLRLAGMFPENDSPLLIPTLFVFSVVTITLIIASGILTSSMVADIVEESEIETGRRSEGVFIAANSLVHKTISGVGVFVSSLVLTAIGFPRGAKPGEVDPEIVRTLGLVYVPALVVLYLIAIAFLATYRIDRPRHEANLEILRTGKRTALEP